MSTNLHEVRSSEAAMALDPTDLPLGTFVKWTTDKGFGGRERARGVVQSVSEKNYIVYNEMWKQSARIPRDTQGQFKRNFVALLTPEEYTQALADNKAEIARSNEESARERKEKDEQDRQNRARRTAERRFAEANPYHFASYLDEALAEEG